MTLTSSRNIMLTSQSSLQCFSNLLEAVKPVDISKQFVSSQSNIPVKTISNLSSWERNCMKLDEIKKLRKNWNGYGANSFSSSVIQNVQKLIWNLPYQPQIFPVADGSIQLEFNGKHNSYLEIQIYKDGSGSAYCRDSDGTEIDGMTLPNLVSIKRYIGNFYG